MAQGGLRNTGLNKVKGVAVTLGLAANLNRLMCQQLGGGVQVLWETFWAMLILTPPPCLRDKEAEAHGRQCPR